MAEEYCGGANWWDSRSRFDGGSGGGGSSTSSTTTTLANSGGSCGFGWLTDPPMASADITAATARSSLDSMPENSPTTFEDAKMDPSVLQLTGLGVSSSQGLEWNHHQQPLFGRNQEKGDNGFRAMLQEGMGLNPPQNFQHESTNSTSTMFNSQLQWRDKFFRGSNEDSSEFKQLGYHELISPTCSSMESTITCQGLAASAFQHDSSSSTTIYGSPRSNILQGFMGGDQQNQLNYHHNTQNNSNNNYLGLDNNQPSSWSNKIPQFLRSPQYNSNNEPYLNVDIARPNLMASLQPQLHMPNFEEKPKMQNTMEERNTSSTVIKKGGGLENNAKRAKSETPTSTLPPFKVRKEKMGDRITALQQLVSPFGKTDTASVLSEAIEYIRLLHEQVTVLSNPYLKSGATSYQQGQQGGEKAKNAQDADKQDLRSRGLCLVPVSSTFPMTHETTVDFWTPTFGGTFR